MSGWWKNLGHDRRVFLLAILAGLPGVALSLGLLWCGAFAAKVRSRATQKVELNSLQPYIKMTLEHLQGRMEIRHAINCNLGRALPGSCVESFRSDSNA